MKKLLFVALAAVGMVACVQNEELAVSKNTAIAFKQHVGNAAVTKVDPSYTKETLPNFQVWGWMTSNAGTVFKGDVVSNTGSAWTYDNTQYWAPERFYSFEAVAPVSNNWQAVEATEADINGITFTNVDGTEDILYAAYEVTTPDMATLAAGYDPVPLQFNHLLSKVQFSFKSAFTTDNVTIKVTNVKMSAPKAGALDLDSKVWTLNDAEGSFDLEFGNATETLMPSASEYTPAADHRLTIPAGVDQVYNISFNVEVIMGTETALNQTVETTIANKALLIGRAYNFKALIGPEVFGLQPIEFTVEEVVDWITEPDFDVAMPTHVKNSAELAAAISAGEKNIVLSSDIAYNASQTWSNEMNLDLNGNTLEVEPSKMLNLKSNITLENGTVKGLVYSLSGDVTLSNVKFTGPMSATSSAEGQLTIKGGNVLVKDCTFSNTSYTGTKPRCISIEGRSSGSIKFENCKFTNTNLERLYANQIKGTATLEFLNCTFSIAPVFAMTNGGLYTNIIFNGCTSSMGLSFEMYDRTSTTGLTAEETAIVEGIFQNNNISSAKLYYSDKTVTKRK